MSTNVTFFHPKAAPAATAAAARAVHVRPEVEAGRRHELGGQPEEGAERRGEADESAAKQQSGQVTETDNASTH